MFSRSRNETYPPPRFHVAFFFFLFLVFKRTTIDTWRGQAAVRQARKRASGGEKARGWKDGGGGGGRVAPHILLISVSIVVSVGTPSLRARGTAKGGEGPSIILSSVSLTFHSPTLPPLTLRSSLVSDLSQPALAFALSTILENARDDERRRSCRNE